MEIAWAGNASVLIRSGPATILFDPFNQPFQKNFRRLRKEELAGISGILITHPHLDHFGDIREFLPITECPVYVCQRGTAIAARQKLDLTRFHTLKPGDTVRFFDLTVVVHQGLHCRLEMKQLPRILQRISGPADIQAALHMLYQQCVTNRIGPKDIYTYEITDGQQKVLLLGSANIYDPDPGPRHADLLVYPFQGKVDMNEYSAEILEFYEPAKVLLSHFDDAFPPLTQVMDTASFQQLMKQRKPAVQIIRPERGKWYTI